MSVKFFRGSIETMTFTIIAAAPMSEGQLVGFDNKVATAGARVLGVAASEAESIGDAVKIVAIGLVDMEAGAAITVGQLLASDASGLPVPATGSAIAFGVATRAAAAGERVSVLIR